MYTEKQSTFIKCRVITGSPGCGKSFLINYIIVYAISKGLKTGVSVMHSCRDVNLGGLHLRKKNPYSKETHISTGLYH